MQRDKLLTASQTKITSAQFLEMFNKVALKTTFHTINLVLLYFGVGLIAMAE